MGLNMQPTIANVHEPTGRKMVVLVTYRGNGLIHAADTRKARNGGKEPVFSVYIGGKTMVYAVLIGIIESTTRNKKRRGYLPALLPGRWRQLFFTT